jgi:ATP-dependent DNA ligase
MLHGDRSIAVTYMAFDVLALDGEPTIRLPYAERHALLEELVVDAPSATRADRRSRPFASAFANPSTVCR